MSLRMVEYSRMRPQPVQVRLQVCSGSSCKTIANFGVLRSLCLMMWLAIFFVSANGKRISYLTDSGEFDGIFTGDQRRRIGLRRIRFEQARQEEIAGETLWLALMPPQPASSSEPAASRAKRRKFQLILTCRV